ncbi:MAG: YbhB/YbcL family Raf kinase inhibitor-like protein [Dokdonella sp.]
MQLKSTHLKDGQPIQSDYAFGQPGSNGEHFAPAANLTPPLAWSEVPDTARSFVITVIDPDVPSVGDDVNQEGRSVPIDLLRVEFVHWLMANIPLDCRELGEGSCGDGIVAHGKQEPFGPPGSVQGCNDYTGWFADDPDMAGRYLGYDGPCPPWNDERLHHYHFEVHALDVARLDLAAGFSLADLRAAMQGHVLASAKITGTYTMNPALRSG